MCFDPGFQEYLQFVQFLRKTNPVPADLPMLPQNMPYYRGPLIVSDSSPTAATAEVAYCETLLSASLARGFEDNCTLSNHPVIFGALDSPAPASAHASNNDDLPAVANKISYFSWAVYSFGGGHFVSIILSQNLPFRVSLACDQYESGRALFREFTECPVILASGNDMLNHIRSCGDNSHVHGYLIHSLRFSDSETTDTFWRLQVTIVSQLRSLRDLQVFIAIVLPDHDCRSVTGFVRAMHKHGWKISKYDIAFPTYGDSVAGACRFVVGVHSSCATSIEPILLKEPPPTPHLPFAFIPLGALHQDGIFGFPWKG